jgi:hypothetical protein
MKKASEISGNSSNKVWIIQGLAPGPCDRRGPEGKPRECEGYPRGPEGEPRTYKGSPRGPEGRHARMKAGCADMKGNPAHVKAIRATMKGNRARMEEIRAGYVGKPRGTSGLAPIYTQTQRDHDQLQAQTPPSLPRPRGTPNRRCQPGRAPPLPKIGARQTIMSARFPFRSRMSTLHVRADRPHARSFGGLTTTLSPVSPSPVTTGENDERNNI